MGRKIPKLGDLAALAALLIVVTAATALLPSKLPFLKIPETYLQDLARDHAKRVSRSDAIWIIKITQRSLAKLAYTEPYDRRELADAIEMIKEANIRALGLDILFDRGTQEHNDRKLRGTLQQLSKAGIPVVLARYPDRNPDYLEEWIENSEALAGHVWFARDNFGVVRSTPHDVSIEIESFASVLADAVGKSNPFRKGEEIAYRLARDNEPFGSTEIQDLKASKALHKKWFGGKIVLIGTDREGVDRHQVPFAGDKKSGELSGIIIHAHILDQILEGRAIERPSARYLVAITAIISLVGMLFAYWPVGTITKLAAGAAVTGFITIGGFILVMEEIAQVPIFWPTLTFIASWGAINTYLNKQYRNEKNYITTAFSHYIDPVWVKHMLHSREPVQRGGTLCTLTILFTDIEDFTNFSETQAPELLVSELNKYLDGVSGCVIRNGGTIDKYIGDAVVAFFGAPVEQVDHAQRAVRCAIEINQFSERFEAAFDANDVKFGRTRIGVHTGQAVVGNVGGAARINYTVIGDAVNTASRLEGSNKVLGTRICVSGQTREQCKNQLFRPIGNLLLKGKSESIAAFEPLDPSWKDNLAEYQAAYDCLEHDPREALKLFETFAARMPDDPLIAFHLRRMSLGETGKQIMLASK